MADQSSRTQHTLSVAQSNHADHKVTMIFLKSLLKN